MKNYRYNALDIAAYLKWSSIPVSGEEACLTLLYEMRDALLARPLAKDYSEFSREVFRQMYHLWSRGFENEFSDVNLIAEEESVALLCDQDFLALENYLKLLALHLIVVDSLPYIRINFSGLPLLIGVEGDYSNYDKNLAKALTALHLTASDYRNEPYNFAAGIPDAPLKLALEPKFRIRIFGSKGYRTSKLSDAKEKMRQLQEESRLRQGSDEQRLPGRRRRGKNNPSEVTRISVAVMPAGSPLPPNPVTVEVTPLGAVAPVSSKTVSNTKKSASPKAESSPKKDPATTSQPKKTASVDNPTTVVPSEASTTVTNSTLGGVNDAASSKKNTKKSEQASGSSKPVPSKRPKKAPPDQNTNRKGEKNAKSQNGI